MTAQAVVRAAVVLQNVFLGKRALPGDPVGNSKLVGQCPELVQPIASADMLKAPMETGGKGRQRLEQNVVALLLYRTSNAEEDNRIAGEGTVSCGMRALEFPETAQV